MKKGILYRAIVLVLICTMLLGLTGFTVTGSDTAGADAQTEGEVVTPGEGTGEDPAATPEPSENPEPEPGEEPENPEPEPDSDKCFVTVDDESKELLEVELPEDGIVQKGTEFHITLKAQQDMDMAVCANAQELKANEDGSFTVVVQENTVLYAFGVGEVTVSGADQWTKDKTVEVKTLGKVSLTCESEDLEITEKNGTFIVTGNTEKSECTVCVKSAVQLPEGVQGSECTKTVRVAVEKLDNTPPELEPVSCVFNDKVIRKSTYQFTYKVTDNLSGVADQNAFEFWRDDGTFPTLAKDSLDYDEKSGTLTFEAVAATAEGLNLRVVDRAGNEWKTNDFSSNMLSLSVNLIQATQQEDETWIAGPNSQLVIEASGDKTEITIQKVDENDQPVGDAYNYANYPESLNLGAIKGMESGSTYTITIKTEKGISTATQSITIQYDAGVPSIEFIDLHPGANWLQGVIHKITGGWLFNKDFRIEFKTDVDVFQYAWKLVKDEDEAATAPAFDKNDKSDESWNYGNIKDENAGKPVTIDIKQDEQFSGSVYLCVWDKAGNCECKQVTIKKGELEDSRVINLATQNDEKGILTVMATTEDANGNTREYTGTTEEGLDWVQNVTLHIFGTKNTAALPKEEPGTLVNEEDETQSEVATTTTYSYSEEAPTVSVEYGDEVKKIPITDENDGNYEFTAAFGKDSGFKYSGEVKVTISYPVMKTTMTEDGDLIGEEKTSISTDLSITIHVQNYLNPATVTVSTEDEDTKDEDASFELTVGTEYGWYNDFQNTKLESLVVSNCPDSTAPATTYYKLTRTSVSDDELIVKQDSNDNGSKALEGTIDNVKDDNLEADLKAALQASGTGIYTLEVWSEDEAGNTVNSKDDPAVYKIRFDNSAPEISACFTETADDFSPYYRKQRVVTIKVTDDAFTSEEDAEKMFDVKFQVKAGTAAPSISEKWQYTGNGVWQIVYTCGDVVENSGLYGDDYTVTVSAEDNAGNTASTDASGQLKQNGTLQNATVVYKGVDVADFNLDQTKPIVSVSFDNNSARNGKYFAAGRTATITVEDHNFDPARVKLDTTGASGQSEWTSNGDVHTKTVSYQNDANCKFSIEVVDKAGNKTVNTEVAYTGVATGEFVIDKTAPILNITGTDATPYPDACTPGISGSDTNMSSEYTLQLTRTVRASRNEDVTALLDRGNVAVSATDINAVFANIPDDAANDGIYVLTASVTDMAGNSTQTTSTFTVNRHGSFYVFNDALSDVVNTKYVEKADGSYTVTEYNASPLVAGSVKIEIYRDGELVKTLTPNVATAAIGASGLYEYVYDLPAENFAQDGRYRVAVSSRDEANNESDSTKLEESLLEFTVDSVPPEITMIKGLEKAIVNADKLDVELSAIDTYGIASVKIVVDGKVVKEFVTQDTYDALMKSGKTLDHEYAVLGDTLNFTDYFTLAQSKDTQNVEIIVTDMAGNMTTTKDDSFEPVYKFNSGVLISTNFFVRFIHNPVAIIGTVLVIAVIAGAIWYIVAGKKKRAQKAAA